MRVPRPCRALCDRAGLLFLPNSGRFARRINNMPVSGLFFANPLQESAHAPFFLMGVPLQVVHNKGGVLWKLTCHETMSTTGVPLWLQPTPN